MNRALDSKERLRAVLDNFSSLGKKEPQREALRPDEIRFKSLLITMENYSISFRQAVKIVGGIVRLQTLMEDGKIRGVKPSGSSNNKWRINAADCYRNVKPNKKIS